MSDKTTKEAIDINSTVREDMAAATVRDVGSTLREADSLPVVTDATMRESPTGDASDGLTARELHETQHEGKRPAPCETEATLREKGFATRRENTKTIRESLFSGHRRGPRTNFPERIEREYEWVRDLEVSSGEADVSVVRSRDTGQEYFFKHYHRGKYPDNDVLSILQNDASEEHVVKVIEYSSDPNDAWEMQEYCPLGTLSMGEWAKNHSYPYGDDVLEQIVKETSEAIHHIHHVGNGIAHRDIKPSNILIRGAEPLNLVLTDFGIARDEQSGTHRTTFAGTNIYAAPEAHEGKSSQASDWFALGAIIYEFLTNEKLLANEGNQNPSPKEAEVNCLQGSYRARAEKVQPSRWRQLIQGLVVYDHHYRWGYSDVSRWLNGELPEVFWIPFQGGYPGLTPEECFQPSWSKELISTPNQLAKSLGENWEGAKKGLAGRDAARIKRFLERFPDSDSVIYILDGKDTIESKLLRLQLMLDPVGIPRFAGKALDTETLKAQISKAKEGDDEAKTWLLGLVRNDALISYGVSKRNENSASAGRNLRFWYDQAEAVKKEIPEDQHPIADEAFRDSLPELFSLAFGKR